MAIILTSEVNGQAVGATYSGDAALVPWLLAVGYALDTSSPTSHISTTAVPPAQDPLLSKNREDPNGDKGQAAVDGVNGDHRDFQFGSNPAVLAAQVYQITPKQGVAAGGTALVIDGDNLTAVTGITIGGTAVTSLVIVSDKKITCVTGAHAAGTVNVILDKSGSTADKTLTGAFKYV